MTTVGIVTGASKGIGLACAERLVDMIDVLVLVDVDEENLTSVAKELAALGAGTVELYPLDVTSLDGLEQLAAHRRAR
jgi:NAD(P)-dependent dehydrogenase (short-subunit alcohol dehydrogenase family)